VIANAISYTHLLTRHIDKEDNAAYTFAKRELSQKTLDTINSECEVFEQEEEAKGTQKKYLQILERLEEEYN
jgi:hemerythrin-like domain-containing protein